MQVNAQIFFNLFNYSKILEHLLQNLHAPLYLLLCMSSHKCEAYERILRCASWRDNGVDEHAVVESELRNLECLVHVMHIERDDGTLSLTNLK